MTGPFTELVGPVLEHVISFQEGLSRGEHPPIDAEKKSLCRLLDESEKRAAAAPELARDFALARHALIYWVDEILVTSSWKHASSWKNAILEIHYFGSPRRAARDFRVRARQAEDQAREGKGRNPLETFYLCAALGFRGELILDEAELARRFDRIHPLVRSDAPAAENAAQGETHWGPRPLVGGRLLVGVSLLVSASALLTVLAFIAAIHKSGS